MTALTYAQLAAAQSDPARPRWHFSAPFGWMNDPNGTIYHQGWYHVFYQWNPASDEWGNIHWGHARSRDLLTWEHLPPALKPSPELGETHCFSGCLVLRADAPPLILYTAIGPTMDVRYSAQQWGAIGDADLLTWRKHPGNPLVDPARPGAPAILEWRDPFVFTDQGRTFLLLGGKLAEAEGGEAVVALYEADDERLERWRYHGLLFRHPDRTRPSVECVNFFSSGGRWVLLLSTHRQVEYFCGDFDPAAGRFHALTSGLLDGGERFYATNLLRDAHGRQVCLGWVRGFAAGRGWNGCLSAPRLLSVDAAGRLRQTPAPELAHLRGEGWRAADLILGASLTPDVQAAALDLEAVVEAGPEAVWGVRLRPVDPAAAAVTLTCGPAEIRLNAQALPFQRLPGEPVAVRLLVDRSVVEVFVNETAALTEVLPPPVGPYRLELWAEAGPAVARALAVWPLP